MLDRMYVRVALVVGSALALVIMATNVSVSAAVSPNLVLLYKFNADTTSSIKDSSTNGLTGTLVNADPDTAFVTGAPGKKLGLQLVASERQYVDVPESSALDVDRFTLAAWIRYTGVSTDDTHGRWEVLEKAGAYWLNIRTDGKVRAGGFFGGCVNSQYWTYLDSNRTVPTSVWTHVAATYNGSKLSLYINGQRTGSLDVTGATCSNDEPLAIGAKNAPAKGVLEAFWDGRLDDVRIYDKALTATRISGLVG
jgi:hypothetical protein